MKIIEQLELFPIIQVNDKDQELQQSQYRTLDRLSLSLLCGLMCISRKKKSPHELSPCNVLDYWPAVVLCLEISFSTEEKNLKGLGGNALGCAISHCVKLWKWLSPNNCAQKMEVLMGPTRGWKPPLDNRSHTESWYELFSQGSEGGEEQAGDRREQREREKDRESKNRDVSQRRWHGIGSWGQTVSKSAELTPECILVLPRKLKPNKTKSFEKKEIRKAWVISMFLQV